MSSDQYKTWEDFPEFYNNPAIQKLSANCRWTVSDNTKRPIDMHALIHEQKIWGLAFDRGYDPLVNLPTLCQTIPAATNNTYYLDALIDKVVVLDVEPKCPDAIKQKILTLPYLYAETSVSGKGLHLLFDLPEDILEKYPIAAKKLALKEMHGYYEILLNHMILFTRNAITGQPTGSYKEFYNMFELLALKEKNVSESDLQINVDEISTDDIPYYETLMPTLKAQIYGKKPEDFFGDMSKYEFGMTGFYYRALCRLLTNGAYKDHTYTDAEKATIIYKLTSAKLPHREKHDQKRSNMPWLLYIAACLIAKSE